MTESVNLYDAKTNLSELVDRVAAGKEIVIVIAKAGKPKSSWFHISRHEKASLWAEPPRDYLHCR